MGKVKGIQVTSIHFVYVTLRHIEVIYDILQFTIQRFKECFFFLNVVHIFLCGVYKMPCLRTREKLGDCCRNNVILTV